MINIFIDTSGSMSEMGKDSGTLYIFKSILDYCEEKNIKISIYKLDGSKVGDILSLEFNEKIQKVNIDNILNTILISDGFLDCENDSFDISFAIGIDCDKTNLNKISKRIFESENIIQGLEYLMFQNNMMLSTINENNEDEW